MHTDILVKDYKKFRNQVLSLNNYIVLIFACLGNTKSRSLRRQGIKVHYLNSLYQIYLSVPFSYTTPAGVAKVGTATIPALSPPDTTVEAELEEGFEEAAIIASSSYAGAL